MEDEYDEAGTELAEDDEGIVPSFARQLGAAVQRIQEEVLGRRPQQRYVTDNVKVVRWDWQRRWRGAEIDVSVIGVYLVGIADLCMLASVWTQGFTWSLRFFWTAGVAGLVACECCVLGLYLRGRG